MLNEKRYPFGLWLMRIATSKYIFLLAIIVIVTGSRSVASFSESFFEKIFIENCEGYCKNGVSRKDTTEILQKLNTEVQVNLINGDFERTKENIDALQEIVDTNPGNSQSLSDSYYYIGLYHLIWGEYSDAIKWLKRSLISREILGVDDIKYAKCLYNLGVAYNKAGDYSNQKYYTLKSLEIEKRLSGESDTTLLTGYATMINSLLGLKEYDEAIFYGNTALKIIQDNNLANSEVADVYTNLGACYFEMSDFLKAALYFEKSENLYRNGNIEKDERFLNVLNNLGIIYGYIGNINKSEEYFNRGIDMANSFRSYLSFNYINSRAIYLASSGEIIKGKELLNKALKQAEKLYGTSSNEYLVVLENYADYLRGFSIDLKQSLVYYKQCYDFIRIYESSINLREPVLSGYAMALTDNGDFDKALEIIQELLFFGASQYTAGSLVINPDINDIIPDYRSLNILKTKHHALEGMYKNTGDFKYLLASAETIDLIVAIIEKVRLNISAEESRLILGDRYRDYYIYAIRDYDLCFSLTGNKAYLDKAFKYFEKSKVAGLLASVRELKATQLQIPQETAILERKLQNEISLYNAVIASEKVAANPDYSMIEEWNESLLRATQRRDSLITFFEENYPGYYLMKYNTDVLTSDEIPDITGRNTNYLNYVVADTFLAVFVVNRKYQNIVTMNIDSVFFNTIKQFRNLITLPSIDNNARNDFNAFRISGHYLYEKLFEPVKQFLISDKLLISPDNLLSNIPFEVIPLPDTDPGDEILYKKLHYIMDDFRISYTYSATFMSESAKKHPCIFNNTVSFAPAYDDGLILDSLTNPNGKEIIKIKDLPYAREEAKYVSSVTNGNLFEGAWALESAFKKKAGNFDIIHLAMHTLLNDRFPMHSKMIFYPEPDRSEDGFLNTYEIYGIPLKAKMVVLSSCNSGTGFLHEGEGILSLARGFAYSGSRSVVLSMWEIEDRSGADIIKNFYRYLKKGYSKSIALNKARLRFLENADQFRSHPYFWSAYVVYGDNAPVYHSNYMILSAITIILICIIAVIHYLKPK